MPEPTPCTECATPGTGRFCHACGVEQNLRFPETDLADHLIAAYQRTKATAEAVPEGEEDSKAGKRAATAYVNAKGRMITLYKLCVEVDRAFGLPDGNDAEMPNEAQAPNEED